MAGGLQDRGTFPGIARTLLALALLAERAAARSLPVRFLVLALLDRAEKIARRFVAREAAALIAEAAETGCSHLPDLAGLDLACLDEFPGPHRGAADAALLALRLRILAAVLAALANGDAASARRREGRSAGRAAEGLGGLAGCVGAASSLPLLLVVRLPVARPLLRPPDTS
ncbi:MAG TPA: hypothetical protein GX405_15465 [Rhizobiales bacterium]|nr:hypothetical protein [Hyphomicrobiales bacterium]